MEQEYTPEVAVLAKHTIRSLARIALSPDYSPKMRQEVLDVILKFAGQPSGSLKIEDDN